MNVSTIGIQLVRTDTATGSRASGMEARAEVSNDRVTASAPPKSPLPSGVGDNVDRTA